MNDHVDANREYVNRLFSKLPKQGLVTNPITGGSYIADFDPVSVQKKLAERGIAARQTFAEANPGLPSLPLSYHAREEYKGSFDISHAIALYARSMEALGYPPDHVPFSEYVAGLLAHPYLGQLFSDAGLAETYPPKPLTGLDGSGYWTPCRNTKR